MNGKKECYNEKYISVRGYRGIFQDFVFKFYLKVFLGVLLLEKYVFEIIHI
jgi:hypothetical protein